MSISDARPTPTQASHGPRFRWRIVPAVPLAILGFLSALLGLIACRNLWLLGYPALSADMFAFVCIILLGITWMMSALAFMKARWLLAWVGTSTGLLIYALAVMLQALAFQFPPPPRVPTSVVSTPENTPGTLTRIGQIAPDFQVTTTDGREIRLSELRGQVVVLSFFATWCGPCLLELPHLNDIWNECNGNGFTMVVIGREESKEELREFKVEHDFSFPMAADSDRLVYEKFATERIPRTYLIAADGTIAYQCTGYYEGQLQTLRTVIRKELSR